MPLWAAGHIANVTLVDAGGTPCKVLVSNPGPGRTLYRGTLVPAASGRTRSQQVPVAQFTSFFFDVQLPFMPAPLLDEVLTAINTSLAAQATFPVHLVSVDLDLDAQCLPDFNSEWLAYKPGSGQILEDLVFKLAAVAANV